MDNQLVSHTLFPNKDSVGKLVEWYKEKTNSLIKQKSLSYDGVPGKYIDVIKNVINLAAIHFAADKLVSGILAYIVPSANTQSVVWDSFENGRQSQRTSNRTRSLRYVCCPISIRLFKLPAGVSMDTAALR